MKLELDMSEVYNQLRNHMFPVFLHQNFPFFYERRGEFHQDLLHDALLYEMDLANQGKLLTYDELLIFIQERIKFYETFL